MCVGGVVCVDQNNFSGPRVSQGGSVFSLALKLLNNIQRDDLTSTSVSRLCFLGVLSGALKADGADKGPKAELWEALSPLPIEAGSLAPLMSPLGAES